MPFFNRKSGVQADYIPDEDQNASPYGDRVTVPESTDESAVRTAERRSIALTEGEVAGPDAIDPSDKGAAEDVTEVDEDVVSVEGAEPQTDMPEPSDNETDQATADAGEGLPRNAEGIEMDFVPEDGDAVEDDGKSDVEAAVDNAEEDADRVDEVVEDQVDEEAAKDEPSGE